MKFRCVSCLREKDRILKDEHLLKCEQCSEEEITFSDAYYEYPPLIVMLDLLLLREKGFWGVFCDFWHFLTDLIILIN